MFDYGLDESNVRILPAHLEAATADAQKFMGGESLTLEQMCAEHFIETKIDPETGALTISDCQSVKEYPQVEAFFRALAPYLSPVRDDAAYLVWGCNDFVQRWYFEDGIMEVEHTEL